MGESEDKMWAEWHTLLTRFPAVELDEFVVMPNHAHGIVWIVGTTTHGATTRVAPTLGDVIGAFKSITTGGYIRGVTYHAWSPFPGRLWQRNYYEQIIRNNKALDGIRQYILDNPAHWAEDAENPEKERR